jgi:hypothetical protein
MPFEFKKARTPREAQADLVKRRRKQPTLSPDGYKPPDMKLSTYADMTPYKIGMTLKPPQPMKRK